ncbi:hypothetical protein [Umezawaea beigongshangensis]|uniref:hypothetical protein n=1 Tax=Umezawaea beigongshangensis TaxID=2780383 RepID=UPI0018F1DA9A|nr:hypothetical protein [Umezawaea beigongshangensis]
MIALLRLLGADVLRSQRYLAPALLYCAVLGMLYSGDAGTVLPAYAGSCALIFPVGAWLAVVISTAEDPVLRTITVVTAGGWGRVLAAVATLTAATVLLFAIVATALPVLTNPHPYTLADVRTGLLAHLVCGFSGAAAGLLLSRPLITRTGVTLLACTAVVVVTFLAGRSTPVGLALWMLGHQDVSVPALLGLLALSVALLAVAVVAGRAVALRR